MSTLLEKTALYESSFDEEDSYYLLSELQLNFPNKYSSQEFSLDDIVNLIDNFATLHAYIDMSQLGYPKFWSPKPIYSFRYLMDSSNFWAVYSTIHKNNGYLVQGSSWTNGFYYIVSHEDFLLEAHLFIDNETKTLYNYQ